MAAALPILRLLALVVMLFAVGRSGALGQDAQRGAHVFRKCAVCHTTDLAEPKKLGPPLAGILGRKAASIDGYEYSDSMKQAGQSGLIWTPEALYYFLDRPDTFMPGTYMTFAGLEEQERRDVIAYLKYLRTSQSPAR